MRLQTDGLREEMRLRDSIRTGNYQRLETSQAKGFQGLTDALRELTQKIDLRDMDLRERVAALEARLPRQ